nr:GNAT family N-acetyltransferase [Mycolicibacter arupensis]
MAEPGGLVFVPVTLDDPLAEPLLTQLAVEYATRYEIPVDGVASWLRESAGTQFVPPAGALLMGVLDGVPVTGGAFTRFDAETAELKRIWTDAGQRRQGHGRALLAELESRVAAAGYRRIYLTTGHRQPEAEALYLATGYRRLDEQLPREGVVFPIAFAKDIA